MAEPWLYNGLTGNYSSVHYYCFLECQLSQPDSIRNNWNYSCFFLAMTLYFSGRREQALLQRSIASLQTYFGSGAWGDLADAISTKFKGSLYPVGNAVSKLVKKDDKYPYAVSIPGKECRYIIAIAQPPADIRILLEKPPTASIRTEVDERSFYRWMTVCNEDAAPTSLSYQVSVTEVDSMVRVSTFSDRPATATRIGLLQHPRIRRHQIYHLLVLRLHSQFGSENF